MPTVGSHTHVYWHLHTHAHAHTTPHIPKLKKVGGGKAVNSHGGYLQWKLTERLFLCKQSYSSWWISDPYFLRPVAVLLIKILHTTKFIDTFHAPLPGLSNL